MGSNSIVSGLRIQEGTATFTNAAEMIIGSKEAQMMKNERLISKVGDSLTNFFGLPSVKIVGILAPTNTLLDEIHIMNMTAFTGLNVKQNLIFKSA